MQVKVAPRQRLRCGSSFFLVKMSPQACSESQKQWLDIERGESKTNWWVSGERGEDMDGSVCSRGDVGKQATGQRREGGISLINTGGGVREGGVVCQGG